VNDILRGIMTFHQETATESIIFSDMKILCYILYPLHLPTVNIYRFEGMYVRTY